MNPQRVIDELRALAAATGNERGAQRLAFTEPWARARAWLRNELRELAVEVEQDPAGNLWATLPGESSATVIVGSHLDSVAGAPPQRMVSGPLHDAAEVAGSGVPAAMLFVQSRGGVSHSVAEDSHDDHLRGCGRLIHWPPARCCGRHDAADEATHEDVDRGA